MEKKKKIKIIFLCIAGFLVFELICILGHQALEKRVRRSETLALVIEIEQFMKNDEEFEAQYGQVLSVAWDDKYGDEIQVEPKVFRILCLVETEKSKYFVWVDVTYSAEEKECRYYSIEECDVEA